MNYLCLPLLPQKRCLTFNNYFSDEAESRLDDLIKSLQKGSADLMKGEDLPMSTFKQHQNDTEILKGNLFYIQECLFKVKFNRLQLNLLEYLTSISFVLAGN